MASKNVTAPVERKLAASIKKQVLDKLEQTLDIEIPRALRAELLKSTVASHRPAAAATTGAPQSDGKCAAIWAQLDKMVAKGKTPELEDIRKYGEAHGWNEHTTRVQFYRWRAAH